MSRTLSEQFAEKVRAAYLEVYGNDPFDDPEAGREPFTLGTVLVCIEADHLDGDHSSIVNYEGSRMAALGLAVRARFFLEND